MIVNPIVADKGGAVDTLSVRGVGWDSAGGEVVAGMALEYNGDYLDTGYTGPYIGGKITPVSSAIKEIVIDGSTIIVVTD